MAALVVLALCAASAPTALQSLPWPDARTVHGSLSLVIGRDADTRLLHDLADHADLAAGRVSAVLGRPVHPVVVVPRSAREAASLAGVHGVDGLAALADRDRVIVVPETFARLTSTGRDVVLTHELTHVVAGTEGVPIWLREGFADYVAYRDAGLPVKTAAAELAAEVRAGRLPQRLPGPQAFAPGAVRLAQSYQEAWLACRFIAERFGEDRLVRLYRDSTRDPTRDQKRDQTSLGISDHDLTARWRDYVREQLA